MYIMNRIGLNMTKLGVRFLRTTPKLKDKIYTDTHEWLLKTNNKIKIGLSNSAIENMNELIYLEYPCSIDEVVSKDDEIVILESVKSVESIKAPFDCVITDHNTILESDLESINEDPENDSLNWIIEIKEI